MIAAACPGPRTGEAFLSGMLDMLDCHARGLGATGYQLLAGSASPIASVVTIALTIFVALFGMRMALGTVPSLRDGVIAAVKIGVVMLLAGSWPAYQVLVYDVVLQGPAELAGTIGRATALPGADGSLTRRLQIMDDAIVAFGARGSGRNDVDQQPATILVRPAPVTDDLALGIGRVAFLGSVIAAHAAIRLASGLLLALAPFFAALLLFDVARDAFVGWLRALFALLLSNVAVALVLGVELALLEPWIADVLIQRTAKLTTLAAPVELLVVTLGFAVALFAIVALLTRLAFNVTASAVSTVRERIALVRGDAASDRLPGATGTVTAPVPRQAERALVVADAITATQRREANAGPSPDRATAGAPSLRQGERGTAHVPLGQGHRRHRQRASQAAGRRDRSA